MGEYTLQRPVEYGGQTVTKLVYREELEVDDLIALEEAKGEMAKARALIASLCGLSVQLVGRMGLADFGAMTQRLAPFLAAGPLTGKSPATTSLSPTTGGPTKSGASRRRSSASGPHARPQ